MLYLPDKIHSPTGPARRRKWPDRNVDSVALVAVLLLLFFSQLGFVAYHDSAWKTAFTEEIGIEGLSKGMSEEQLAATVRRLRLTPTEDRIQGGIHFRTWSTPRYRGSILIGGVTIHYHLMSESREPGVVKWQRVQLIP